jgi:hypothetical protein
MDPFETAESTYRGEMFANSAAGALLAALTLAMTLFVGAFF